MGTIFEKPTQEQVKEWYDWALSLNHGQNAFHPTKGGQYWDVNNNNETVIRFAGVTATTDPAHKPSNIPNLNAIVAGSAAKAVFDDGDGNPTQKLPSVATRNIPIKGILRGGDLYIPVSTELATTTKYPQLKGASLSQLAAEIIDREDVNGVPPAFVEFQDAQGNKHTLNGNQLKAGFRVNGTIDQLSVSPDNIFMLPPGSGAAAFSDYAVILKRDRQEATGENVPTLKPGTNTLRFGVDGKFFSYTIEYKINA
jgi:hypothetical protein